MKKGIFSACLTFFFLFNFLVGCSQPKTVINRDPIKIGVVGHLSGDFATYGGYMRDGLELALQEINQAGGVLDREVELIYEDDQGDAKKAVTAIDKLINQDQVPVVIGSFASSVTLAMAPKAEQTQTVLLAPAATSIKLSEAGDYVFRIAPKDDLQGKQLAEFAKQQDYTKAAILYINNDWGQGLAKAFEQNFEQIIFSQAIDENTTDVKTEISKLKSLSPDVLFAPCFEKSCITIIKQSKELNLKTTILSADGFETQAILDAVGKQADDVIFTTIAPGSGQKWQEFSANFQNKYSSQPNIWQALSYDSLYVVTEVIKSAQSLDSTQIKNAMYQVDYTGASGRNKFDLNGDVDKPFKLKTIKDGQFVDY